MSGAVGKVYVGDTGTEIVLDCGTDVSTASARAVRVRKPDGSTQTWPATAEGATAITAVAAAGAFDQRGVWRLQAEVTTTAGKWLGQTVRLPVYAAWE